MEPEAECILVIIGATPEGRKELLGFHVGVRESGQTPAGQWDGNYLLISRHVDWP